MDEGLVKVAEDTQSIELGETGGPHHESAILFDEFLFTAIQIHSMSMKGYDTTLSSRVCLILARTGEQAMSPLTSAVALTRATHCWSALAPVGWVGRCG